MKTRHRQVTLRELCEYRHPIENNDFHELRAKIKKLKIQKDDAQLSRIYEECKVTLTGGGSTISNTKEIQWRIVYYALLLDAALVTGISLLANVAEPYRFADTILGITLSIGIAILGTRMICKVDRDLDYYRSYISMYEVLRNDIVGLQLPIEEEVVRFHSFMKSKTDRFKSSLENRNVFSLVFYAALWGASLAASLFMFSIGIIN
jgi:hypothetical protein